jgi:putative ABC transport system substrate-binding protein
VKRRLILQSVCAAAGPLQAVNASAQGVTGAIRRVGVLGPDPSDGSGSVWEAFVDELAQRGFAEGRNLVFERRFAESDSAEQLQRLAAELVAKRVDVIYAARGNASALAAKNATSAVPVVFYSSPDPVGAGLVFSLASPGGNVTGMSTQGADIVGKGLQLLAEAVGGLHRFSLFVPEGTRTQGWFGRSEALLRDAAKHLGAAADIVEMREAEQLVGWLRSPARRGVDAGLLFDFPLFRPHLARIAALFVEHRLPSYGSTKSGFLMQYDLSRTGLARDAAAYVARILRGARPADLPVEQVRTFELSVNLRTARALGLAIPRTLLLRADEVLE